MDCFSLFCLLVASILPLISTSPIQSDTSRDSIRTRTKAFAASLTSQSDRQLYKQLVDHLKLSAFNQQDIQRILSKHHELKRIANGLLQMPIVKSLVKEAAKDNVVIRLALNVLTGGSLNLRDLLPLATQGHLDISSDLKRAATTVLNTQYLHQGLSHKQKWEKAIGKTIGDTRTEMTDSKYIVTSNIGLKDSNNKVAELVYLILDNVQTLKSLAFELNNGDQLSTKIVLYDLLKLNLESGDKSFTVQDQEMVKMVLGNLLSSLQSDYNGQITFTYENVLLAAQSDILPLLRSIQSFGKIIIGLT